VPNTHTGHKDLTGDFLLAALEYVQDQSDDLLLHAPVDVDPGLQENCQEYWPPAPSTEPHNGMIPWDTFPTLRSFNPELESGQNSPLSPPLSPYGARKRGSVDSPSPPAKRKSVTNWRKGQDEEIEKNEERLRGLEAASEEKEMIVMFKEAVLQGLQGLKTYDFNNKMKTFAGLKTDMMKAKKEMEERKLRCQKKAKYQRLQHEQISRCQAYISQLYLQIRKVTSNIEQQHRSGPSVYSLY